MIILNEFRIDGIFGWENLVSWLVEKLTIFDNHGRDANRDLPHTRLHNEQGLPLPLGPLLIRPWWWSMPLPMTRLPPMPGGVIQPRSNTTRIDGIGVTGWSYFRLIWKDLFKRYGQKCVFHSCFDLDPCEIYVISVENVEIILDYHLV
jgi:hypothetical protein